MTKEAHASQIYYRMPRGLITMDLLVSQIFFFMQQRSVNHDENTGIYFK
jgi:succinate dehydrogenase flavin-adding protein (antitoxin of CptAB toxin-antitoxin module)